MKTKVLSTVVAGLILVGCGERSPDSAAEQHQAPAQPTEVPAAPTPAPTDDLPVADGLGVDFDYVVSSRREIENEDGSVNHVLRVVYIDADTQAVAESLENALRKRQFRVERVSEEGTKLSYVARGDGAQRIRYVLIPVGPDLTVDLRNPNARGMVTFYWKD